MSVGFIRSNVVRKVVSAMCLLTFPAVAQQANTGLSMQATPVGEQQPATNGNQQSTTPGASEPSTANGNQPSASPQQGGQSQPGKAPLPEAPQVKNLPQPTNVDYS